jgi:hypothetical protein
MKSSLYSRAFGRWLIPAAVILTLAICVLGFGVDQQGFFGNLLAELSGVFISVIVALLIVDRYVKYQREQEWTKVQDFTLRSIATHLCEIVGAIFLHYPAIDYEIMTPIFEGHSKPPNPNVLRAFNNLIQELQQYELPREIAREKSESDIAIEYYDAVRWDLDQIQNVLTPRVMQSSTDQNLIDLLIEFDSAHRQLHHSIIGHQQAVTQAVFSEVISLVGSAARLYEAIYECRKEK